MGYLKKNSSQAGRSFKAGKRTKQDRRWTLLFIGNHGRTITLKRFKGIVITSVTVLAVCIAVSAGLLVWNQKIIMDNHDLKNDIKNLNARIDALQHDNDILMTRLVLAESRVQESLAGKIESPATDEPPEPEQPASNRDDRAAPAVAKNSEPPTPEQAEPRKSGPSSTSKLSVGIENFQIFNHPDDNRLNVQFKIKNTSPNSQRVSGHIIVVLKGEQTNWLPIPWIALVDGRPSGQQRGHTFGINYFKTMRLSSRPPDFPEKFETASIYVFTRDGELLLEQKYPVDLPPIKPQVAKPLTGQHAIPKESASQPIEPLPEPEISERPSEDTLMETLKDPSSQ